MGAVKVGTCNYCGTRAALVLSGETRHELSCSNCGAPLHDLKFMPKQPKPAKKSHRAIPASSHQRAMSKRDKPGKKHKKKKSKGSGLWGEIWDIVEDIID
jgi:hypothetical protein